MEQSIWDTSWSMLWSGNEGCHHKSPGLIPSFPPVEYKSCQRHSSVYEFAPAVIYPKRELGKNEKISKVLDLAWIG